MPLRRIIKRFINQALGSKSSTEPAPRAAPVVEPAVTETDLSNIECSAQELRERLEAGEEIVIVDVREDFEVSSGVIPGARHIPLRMLPTLVDGLRDANEIVCYCAGGARSYDAAMLLRREGLFNATSMEGGMAAWRAIGCETTQLES